MRQDSTFEVARRMVGDMIMFTIYVCLSIESTIDGVSYITNKEW